MTYKNPNYHRDYKRRKRLEAGKHTRKIRTTEEIQQALVKRKIYEKEYAKNRPYSITRTTQRLIWSSRRRAKVRGLEHTITEKDIRIPTHCPYLGTELVPHVPRGSQRHQCISLDRKDNNKGYTPDNIEVISHLANTMKCSATSEQLKNFALEILKRHP